MNKLLCAIFGHKWANSMMYGYGVPIFDMNVGIPWKCLRCREMAPIDK